MKDFVNRSFIVDGLALFATKGQWHVLLQDVAELDADRVSVNAVVCAAYHQRASWDEIESAFRFAIRRMGENPDAVDWVATRERATMIRRAWPIIAEACRKAVAGES